MDWSKRQEEIVMTAIKIIAHEGIQEFTTKKLAKEVGVSEPALYRHFTNKSDILCFVIDYVEEQSMSILKQTEKLELDAFEKIMSFISSRFILFSANPDLAYIVFNESIFQNDEKLANKMYGMMKRHRDFLFMNINTAKQEGLIRNDLDNESLFLILIGATRLLINQWLLNPQDIDLMQKGYNLSLQLEKVIKSI